MIIDNFYKSFLYDKRYMYIFEGLLNTLLIAFFAVIIGVLIGSVIAIIRNYHENTKRLNVLNFLGGLYVNVIRGTPVILQLMIIYYVIFKTSDINILIVGIIAFGINSGAYVAEIIRAGIDSIPKDQLEGGLALGLNYFKCMRYIVMPQAIKNILPALGNEFITLVKETSVGSMIGIVDLTKASDIIASRTYEYFFPLIMVAIIYLIITIGLSKLVKKMEVKLGKNISH